MSFLLGALLGGGVDSMLGDDSILDGTILGGVVGSILGDGKVHRTIAFIEKSCDKCGGTIFEGEEYFYSGSKSVCTHCVKKHIK